MDKFTLISSCVTTICWFLLRILQLQSFIKSECMSALQNSSFFTDYYFIAR